MKTLVFFILAFFVTNVFSMEVMVSDNDNVLPECTRKIWNRTGVFNTLKSEIIAAPKKITIKLLINTDNSSEENHRDAVQNCATEAGTQIGINVIALQPNDSTNAYRDAFLSCLTSRNITLSNINTFFLKSDSVCLWVGEHWAAVVGSDENIRRITRMPDYRIYLKEGYYSNVKELGNYQSASNALLEIQRTNQNAFLVNLDEWCQSPSPVNGEAEEYLNCD